MQHTRQYVQHQHQLIYAASKLNDYAAFVKALPFLLRQGSYQLTFKAHHPQNQNLPGAERRFVTAATLYAAQNNQISLFWKG